MATNERGQALSTKRLYKYLDGEVQADGSKRAGIVYVVKASELLDELPERGVDTHPLFGSAWVNTSSAWRHHDRLSASCVFLTEFYTCPSGSTEQEEEADSTANQEPIETNVNFATLAGTAAAPALGAIWRDSQGRVKVRTNNTGPVYTTDFGYDANTAVFERFQLAAMAGSPSYTLAGAEAYLVPKGNYTRSYTSTTKPSLAGVGTIQGTTPAGAPTLAAGFVWLSTRIAYRGFPGFYRISESYLAGKWNTGIYATTP